MQKVLNFFKGLGTIFLYFFISLLVGLFLGDFYESTNQIIANLSQLSLYLILLIILFLIYHKELIKNFQEFKKEYFKIALKNWILGLGFMLMANIFISTFINELATNESLNRELLFNYPLSNIISMIFLGPLIEEITFRLSFRKAFNNWLTFCLTTALFFGIAHNLVATSWLELLYIIPYSALGFFMAKAYYDTNNIFTSFIMHATHNATCILLLFLI